MAKEFNLIKNKGAARLLGIITISIALLIVTLEFIFTTTFEGFTFENLVTYLFELIVNGVLIYSLIIKKPTLIEISLVVAKVFEGTYYPIRSAQRLDILVRSEVDTLEVVSHIFFAVTAFSLLVALLLFCIYKVLDKKVFWDAMKISILVSTSLMLISTVFYIITTIMYQGLGWEEILEPLSMSIMFFGMFAICEYVEEETIYA